MPAHKRNQREKGVALLFSLGILGLMTVLALTFASVSMTSQQTAKNATNKASARFLASSIPAHIASLLYQDAYFTKANTPALAHMPLYSKTQSESESESETETKSYDWIWKLAIRDASLKSAIYEMDAPNYNTPEQNPTWQYISRKEDGEDKIVARIAYVAVPSEALIDLNSTLLMEDGTKATAYTRRGISICGELEPAVLFNQIPKETEGDDTFHFKESEAKTGASQDRFTSYDEIQRYIAGGLAANVLKQFNRRFVRAFAPNSVRYPEVFTLPGTTEVYHRIDLVQLSKKIAVLSENSKRKDALNSILSEMGKGKSMLIPNLKESPFSEANSPFRISNGESGEGPFAYPQIPWFKEFKTSDLDLSGFANSDTKRNQIVANFLDFFTPVTSDDGTKIAPTSDIDPNSWSVDGVDDSKLPKYTGLKKTPYICGFGAVIEAVATYEAEGADADGNKLYKYKINLTADVDLCTEVINMYTNMEDTNSLEIVVGGSMTLEGTLGGAKSVFSSQITLNPADVKVKVTPKSTEVKTQTSRRYIVKTLKEVAIPNLSGSYVQKDGLLFTSENEKLPEDEIPNLKITAIKLQPRIILKWNDLPVDFADLSTTDAVTFSTTEEETGPQLNGSIYFAAARRVSDPRHNLVPSAWNGNWICAKAPAAEILTVPALLNDTVDSSAGTTDAGKLYTSTYATEAGEGEVLSTLAALTSNDLPNVYLRGSPIGDRTSFHAWELAFIHRAAPWENFNFTKYAANAKGELVNKGGTSYGEGDLGLLDQLKLTWYTDSDEETSSEKKEKTDSPKLYSYGKLNVNELTDKNYHAFLALLLKAVPEKNNPGETEITYKDVPLSATAPADYFQQKANSSTPFKSRVQIFHSLGGVDLWEGVSDSDKAKLFPSLIFLLDAEPTVLPRRAYVLGIAQTIKDVKGNYSKYWGTDYQYPSGFQTPEGNNVTNPQVSGDTTAGTADFNQYDLGADQITGEQKVFSVLEREYTLQPYSTSNCPKWTIKEVKYADY